ncbi:MAG: UDP-N-acetylmuramate dehydrogenase, partial [Bacteroidales bacterium]
NIDNEEDLLSLLKNKKYKDTRKYWLGGGSNLLFLCDVKGMVIHLSNKGMEILREDNENVYVQVQAGVVWDEFVKYTVEKGWWGVENLIGVPGQVGSACVQNIGAYGVEVQDSIYSVEVVDVNSLEINTLLSEDCKFAYRDSIFKHRDQGEWVVWSVCFSLSKNPEPRLGYARLKEDLKKQNIKHPLPKDIAKIVQGLRKEKLPDPKVLGSAGSFFKNPVVPKNIFETLQRSCTNIPGFIVEDGVKLSSAWLIEQCGWKGYREGDAGVYEKQALVLVNYGTATGEELWDLAQRIQKSVEKKFGVCLEPEVRLIGGEANALEERYEEVLKIMYSCLPMFQRIGGAAYKADLKNTEILMDALHEPYKRFKCIHVGGTNGKGSCSHMIASVLQSAGYKTGLYTSPHLHDFRERIKINGELMPKEAVVNFYEQHETLFHKVKASFFEMTVAMAFDYFAKERVDIAVIEVGMGGRLDSTNVITPQLSVITNISMDHMQYLGDTLPKIAEEKAGIIKEGVPVVIGESHIQTMHVFMKKAKEYNARIIFADSTFSLMNTKNENRFSFDIYRNGDPYLLGMSCDLCGESYQSKNVITAIAAIDIMRETYNFGENAIRDGFRLASEQTGLKGRWQCLSTSPLVYCDTGHNEAGISLVLKQIEKTPYRKLHIVWGMVSDKDIDHILDLLPAYASYYFCNAAIVRALPAEEMAKAAHEKGLKGKAYDSVLHALNAAKEAASEEDLIYVGGSTFVVAEIC